MDFDRLWIFMEENKDFFHQMAYNMDIQIDYGARKFSKDGVWNPDPFYLFTILFRNRFESAEPSKDSEYTRIYKALNATGVRLPIKKINYDDHLVYDNINQSVLDLLETSLGMVDGEIIIPTKDSAVKSFGNISESLENITKGLFLYEGSKALCCVDVYDRLTGFEVLLDNDSIFLGVRDYDIPRCAFRENLLCSVGEDSTISIAEIGTSYPLEENIVYLSTGYTDAIKNVTRFFNAFNVVGDDGDFIIKAIDSIGRLSSNRPTIIVNGEPITAFISDYIISIYLSLGASSMVSMVDAMKASSYLGNIEKQVILDSIASDLSGDIIDLLKPYIDGLGDDHLVKVGELLTEKHIELVARIVQLDGGSSMIRLYNKKYKYYKDFEISKRGVVGELFPEIGGQRYIASYCDIREDSVPSGFTSVESYISHISLKVVHNEFGMLPTFSGFKGSGTHKIGNKIVFNSGNTVLGVNGKHSFDGVLFKPNNMDVSFPRNRISKSQARENINSMKDMLSGFIVKDGDRDMAMSVLLFSTLLMPILKHGNKITIAVNGAGAYSRDGMIQKIFKGCFRASTFIHTLSDYIIEQNTDGSTSVLVTRLTSKNTKIMSRLSTERYGTKTLYRLKNTDMSAESVNTTPLFVFSDDAWTLDESFVFNFPIKASSEAGAFLCDTTDLSGSMVGYILHNSKKVELIEEKIVSGMRKKINTKDINARHPYVDFFEKILAGMCLVDLAGYMDPWEYHDKMYDTFFDERSIRNIMNFESLLLSIVHNGVKVEDKIFDEGLRKDQKDDIIKVDRASHVSNLKKGDTNTYVLVFSKREVYDKIKDEIDMSRKDFSIFINNLKSSISQDSSYRNWKMEHDNSITIWKWYKSFYGNDKDNFATIKINKKEFYNIK